MANTTATATMIHNNSVSTPSHYSCRSFGEPKANIQVLNTRKRANTPKPTATSFICVLICFVFLSLWLTMHQTTEILPSDLVQDIWKGLQSVKCYLFA